MGYDFGQVYTSKLWKEQLEVPVSDFAERVYGEC